MIAGLSVARNRDRLVPPFNDIDELAQFSLYFGQGKHLHDLTSTLFLHRRDLHPSPRPNDVVAVCAERDLNGASTRTHPGEPSRCCFYAKRFDSLMAD